jgi:hypothetical protein
MLLLMLAALLLPACNQGGGSGSSGRQASAKPKFTAPPTVTTIAYIGGLRGFERPCGCDSHQSGGLPRLESVLVQLRDPQGSLPEGKERLATYPQGAASTAPVLLFDCGSFAPTDAHFPDLRVQTHLKILEALGAAGAILGSAELALAKDDASAAFAKTPVPLASCNVKLELPGVELQPSLELCPGWYVIGVTAWQAIPGVVPPGWWQLSEPVAAVQAVLAKLPQDAHVIISALDQSPAVVAQLATLPVAVVIGDAAGQAQRDGATVLPPPIARISTLTLAQFAPERRVPLAWSLELVEGYADGPQITELLAAEQEESHNRLYAAKGSEKGRWQDNKFTMSGEYLPQEKPVYDYVGADACASCHSAAYQAWLKSRHCQALASLVEKNEQETLDCLQCHTVALLKPGGYDPLEPRGAVSAVSCESCHGPGRAHAELMVKGAPPAGGELKIIRGTTADCARCHDDFNSPSFKLPGYWEMIKH